MSVFLQPIYTQTVGSGGAATVTFNNIPQGYTDLVIKASCRSNFGANYVYMNLFFNGVGTSQSATNLLGTGSAVSSDRNAFIDAGSVAANATSLTFSNVEIYIPNYTSSNYKSFIADAVSENNASAAYQSLTAGLWSNTSAINSIYVQAGGTTIQQYSTFALYGVLRQGI